MGVNVHLLRIFEHGVVNVLVGRVDAVGCIEGQMEWFGGMATDLVRSLKKEGMVTPLSEWQGAGRGPDTLLRNVWVASN